MSICAQILEPCLQKSGARGVDGWMGGWMDGWIGGWYSRFKDCLQQSKMTAPHCRLFGTNGMCLSIGHWTKIDHF